MTLLIFQLGQNMKFSSHARNRLWSGQYLMIGPTSSFKDGAVVADPRFNPMVETEITSNYIIASSLEKFSQLLWPLVVVLVQVSSVDEEHVLLPQAVAQHLSKLLTVASSSLQVVVVALVGELLAVTLVLKD